LKTLIQNAAEGATIFAPSNEAFEAENK